MTSETIWLLRLLFSALLGGAIGLEREIHGREAGFRTLILVSTGACLVMITSLRLVDLFPLAAEQSVIRLDPGRIAYGVITGIGFLGAGAIVRDRQRVRGITTASCLWVVAAVGLACGTGLYLLSLSVTAIALFTLYVLKYLEHYVPRDSYNTVKVVQAGEAPLEPCLEIFARLGVKVLESGVRVETPPPRTEMNFSVRHRNPALGRQVVQELLKLPAARVVEWR